MDDYFSSALILILCVVITTMTFAIGAHPIVTALWAGATVLSMFRLYTKME